MADRLRPTEAEQRPSTPGTGRRKLDERSRIARRRMLAGEPVVLRGGDDDRHARPRRRAAWSSAANRASSAAAAGAPRRDASRRPGPGHGDASVRAFCCEGEVPRALLWVGDSRRQAPVCVSRHGDVHPGARNRRKQGVSEADTVVRDLDHVRVDRRAKQLRRVGVQRTGEQVDQSPARAAKPERRALPRQERKPARDELLQRGRDREWLAGRDRNVRRSSARPSSSAKNGFPPDASTTWSSVGRVSASPRRSRSSACTAFTSSPPSWTRVRRSPSNAGPQASERSPASARAETRTATVSLRSRRNANSSTARDDVSPVDIVERDEHGLFTRQLPKDAEESSRDGAAVDQLGSTRRRASSARRCGVERAPRRRTARGDRRETHATASAATGCADRTKYESEAATALRQSVVFPIPASPSSTRAAGARRLPQGTGRVSASSCCRPTTEWRSAAG